MYDIDPPARILLLNAPRQASQPTRDTDRQHLARIAQADPIAVRHSVGQTSLGQFVADWSDPVYRMFAPTASDDVIINGIARLLTSAAAEDSADPLVGFQPLNAPL